MSLADVYDALTKARAYKPAWSNEEVIPPGALMLEITEGILLQDQLARSVVALSKEGFRFSLDDFGTGYSSLAYLKRLPVHELKIDRAFVRDIEVDEDDAALVQAILSIARRFNIQTVAEGVETPAQLDFLSAHGCDALQGYFFDKPQPWREFITKYVMTPPGVSSETNSDELNE